MTIISRYFSLSTNGNKTGSNLELDSNKHFGVSCLQASMFESEIAKSLATRVGCSKSQSITGRIEDKKTRVIIVVSILSTELGAR